MADLSYLINFASNTLGIDRANSAINKLGVALAAVGVGVAAVKLKNFFSDAIDGAAEFEQQLATVQAVSGSTVEQMDRIKEASIELGKTTRYNATQAAEGFEILARAGLNTEQSLETIPSVLALAQGNALGLSEAAGFVTKAVQGMGLEFSEAGRVADVLAKASASANTDVSGLGAALSYAAPTAASLGITIEETAAYIGKFADAGVDASRAGTAFNGILSQFGNSASTFRRELANINITTDDFNLAIRQLAEAGPQGQKAIQALGLEAGPAFKALLAQGMDALDGLTAKLYDAGGAAENQAEVMSNTWQGALAGLDSAWSTLKDTLGESFLDDMTQSFKDLGTEIISLVDSGKVEEFGENVAAEFKKATTYVIEFVRNVDMAELLERVGSSLDRLQTIATGANGAFQALSIFFYGLKNGVLAVGVALSMLLTVGVEVHKFFVDTGLAIAKFFGFTGTAIEGYSESLGGALKASEDFRAYADEEMAKTAESIHKSFNSIAGVTEETTKTIEGSGSQIAETFNGIANNAYESAQETSESLKEIRENTSEMIDGFGAPSQFAELLEAIVDTGSEAAVGSELMNRLIIGAGDLAGEHKAVVEDAKNSMTELGMTAEAQAEKTRTAIEGTFSALNIDVQQNLNGVNTKTQQTFDLIANGAKSVAESTYSATEKAQLLSALFAEGLNAAKTKEEFAALNDVTKHYGLSSVITAEQQKVLKAGMQGGAEAATAAADANASQTAELDKNAVAAEQNAEKTRDVANAKDEQAAATDKAATATDAATQNESASLAVMQQMTATIKGKISALESMGATTEQIDATWNRLTDSMNGTKFLGIQDFTKNMQRVDDVVTKQISSFEQAKTRADDMTQALGGSAVTSRDLAEAQHALRTATDASVQGLIRMDQATLDNLKKAIDDTKQKMKDLADEARDTAQQLEGELAKLRGEDDKALEIEQAKDLQKIEDLLSEARKRGNAEEIKYYSEALKLQKEINKEERKQASASDQKQSQKSNSTQEYSRPNTPSSNTQPRKIVVELKSSAGTVDAEIPASQESMFEAFVKQLQESKAIAGQ